MTIYFSFMLTAIILISLIGLRNELVLSIRRRTTLVVATYNTRELGRWGTRIATFGKIPTSEEIRASVLLYPYERQPGHVTMVFDLTKWTFEGFYPDLVSVDKDLKEYYSKHAI